MKLHYNKAAAKNSDEKPHIDDFSRGKFNMTPDMRQWPVNGKAAGRRAGKSRCQRPL